jgi:hypothetical protein
MLYLTEVQLGLSYSNLDQDLATEGTGTFVNLFSNSAQFSKLNVPIWLQENTKQ